MGVVAIQKFWKLFKFFFSVVTWIVYLNYASLPYKRFLIRIFKKFFFQFIHKSYYIMWSHFSFNGSLSSRPTNGSETISDNRKPFKNDEKWFSWLFGYAGKGLDKKAMINFKIYEVTDWAANNYNTHITQMVSTLIWIYFGRLWLGHTIKINFITF